MHDDHHHHVHDHHHHGPGHNHPHGHGEHLHSHVHGDAAKERAEELRMLAAAFLEGYRKADDKTSFLRVAGVPFKRQGADGLAMHLVETRIESRWQLGTASPAFGSRELVYLPYPGGMVTERETMTFTYVSLTGRADIDLTEILETRIDT
ncbi:MAG: hypothetical protein Kow0026_28610 [Oricola sp.]